eukprot:TRINITY_DN15649_c0_g2_i1.p1 TRINITY_DN15649_c0_g2~~TRINITY_DN15649_c0_g2_i1.p1  ORF type:complete len:399 (-),score=75.47 TRINITY_DN15649_c0_g2_i1:92-1267(-)
MAEPAHGFPRRRMKLLASLSLLLLVPTSAGRLRRKGAQTLQTRISPPLPGEADGTHPQLISVASYLRSADIVDRPEAPCKGNGFTNGSHAEEVAQKILNAKKPLVAELQRPCWELDRFLQVMKSGGNPPHPYVLVLIDGDYPFEANPQREFRMLQNLKAVYVTNLKKAMDPDFFFPFPQGMCYHCKFGNYEQHLTNVRPELTELMERPPALVEFGRTVYSRSGSRAGAISEAYRKVNATSQPWASRKKKMLIAAMSNVSIRNQYKARLKDPEFADLVDFWDERVPIETFLKKVAEYQFLLSPPGGGYDCYRHWEALAVGTVPMVTVDPSMDLRLFDDSGATWIPPPEDLTKDSLAAALAKGRDPSRHAKLLYADYWRKRWRKHLPAQIVEA